MEGISGQAELFYQDEQLDQLFYVIEEAQGLFGADAYMDWAQIMKAEAQFAMRDYEGRKSRIIWCLVWLSGEALHMRER